MRKYILVLLPLLPGVVLVALQTYGLLAAPVFYLRADLGNLVLALGLVAALVTGSGLTLRMRSARRWQQALAGQQAQQAEAHRRFVRRLDHELKNPLTAIRAGLANLSGETVPPMLAAVRGQVDRLARLTADLRKLADLETQPLDAEPVHLDRLLDELYGLVQERPESGCRQLRLVVPSAPWPLPVVSADPDLLFLALHNLVDNALKFSREGDTVELRASEDGAFVSVEVADTGPGIPAGELPHVGEELYRGSAARAVDGSGLGLALARAIAVHHGGALAVRSRAGHGTVVTLRLPIPRS